MRRIVSISLVVMASLALTAIVAMSNSMPALASTNYLARAAAALNQGQLQYAAPSTPGYSIDSTSNITSPEAPIALVEVPAIAIAETGGSAQQFANELSDLTGHRLIIGIAFVTGSNINPSATYFTSTSRLTQGYGNAPADQMRDAESKGQSPEDVLGTFGRDMQLFLQNYPNALRPMHVAPPSSNSQPAAAHHGGSFPALPVSLLLALVLGGAWYWLIKAWRGIPGQMVKLGKLIPQINDPAVRQTIQDIRTNAKSYIEVVRDNKSEGHFSKGQLRDAKRAVLFNLKNVLDVGSGYVNMQDHPRNWSGDTDARLRATAASLRKFDSDLVAAIQGANDGNLAAFEVNMDVLAHSAF